MKNRLRSMGLFPRIFLMIVTSSVIMLVGFAILGIQAVNDSMERTLQELRTLAEVIAGRVDARSSVALFAWDYQIPPLLWSCPFSKTAS